MPLRLEIRHPRDADATPQPRALPPDAAKVACPRKEGLPLNEGRRLVFTQRLLLSPLAVTRRSLAGCRVR